MLTESRVGKALLWALTILAWMAVLVGAGWLISRITGAILIVVLAAVVAYAVTPLVNLLSRFMHRHIALALAYVIGFAVVLGLIGFVVMTAASQVMLLVLHMPTYVARAQELQPQVLTLLRPFGVSAAQLHQFEQSALAQAEAIGSGAAHGAIDVVQTVLGAVVDAVLVLILSVYLAANGPRIGGWLREHGRLSRAYRVESLIGAVNQVVGGYVRGTLAMASLVGALVGIGMQLIGLPYAVLLGVVAFFMEFVPVVGVMVSGLFCVVVALTQPPWWRILIVVAYFAVVHIIEGDLVGPRVMGRAVGIHPAVALFALAAGTELFGIWGALFGAPIAGLIQGLVVAAWRDWQRFKITQPDLAVSTVVRADHVPAPRPEEEHQAPQPPP